MFNARPFTLLGGLLLVYPLNAWRDAPIFPTPSGALQGLAAQLALPPGAISLRELS